MITVTVTRITKTKTTEELIMWGRTTTITGGHTTKAVSYTHLDVYKRQVLKLTQHSIV